MSVGDQAIRSNTGIAQDLVLTILFRSQHAAQILPLASEPSPVGSSTSGMNAPRNRPARAGQDRRPLGIGDIGFAPRHRFDMTGIELPGQHAGTRQRGKRTLPVHAGARHDHAVRSKGAGPFGQGPRITLEGTERTVSYRRAASGIPGEGAGADLGLKGIQTDDQGIDGGVISMAAASSKALQSCGTVLKGTVRQRPVSRTLSVRCPPLLAQGRQASGVRVPGSRSI